MDPKISSWQHVTTRTPVEGKDVEGKDKEFTDEAPNSLTKSAKKTGDATASSPPLDQVHTTGTNSRLSANTPYHEPSGTNLTQGPDVNKKVNEVKGTIISDLQQAYLAKKEKIEKKLETFASSVLGKIFKNKPNETAENETAETETSITVETPSEKPTKESPSLIADFTHLAKMTKEAFTANKKITQERFKPITNKVFKRESSEVNNETEVNNNTETEKTSSEEPKKGSRLDQIKGSLRKEYNKSKESIHSLLGKQVKPEGSFSEKLKTQASNIKSKITNLSATTKLPKIFKRDKETTVLSCQTKLENIKEKIRLKNTLSTDVTILSEKDSIKFYQETCDLEKTVSSIRDSFLDLRKKIDKIKNSRVEEEIAPLNEERKSIQQGLNESKNLVGICATKLDLFRQGNANKSPEELSLFAQKIASNYKDTEINKMFREEAVTKLETVTGSNGKKFKIPMQLYKDLERSDTSLNGVPLYTPQKDEAKEGDRQLMVGEKLDTHFGEKKLQKIGAVCNQGIFADFDTKLLNGDQGLPLGIGSPSEIKVDQDFQKDMKNADVAFDLTNDGKKWKDLLAVKYNIQENLDGSVTITAKMPTKFKPQGLDDQDPEAMKTFFCIVTIEVTISKKELLEDRPIEKIKASKVETKISDFVKGYDKLEQLVSPS